MFRMLDFIQISQHYAKVFERPVHGTLVYARGTFGTIKPYHFQYTAA